MLGTGGTKDSEIRLSITNIFLAVKSSNMNVCHMQLLSMGAVNG